MSIGQRIIELREMRGLARKDLAAALNITYDALSKYETDERQVDHELLIMMADFFGVTTDFLLGRRTEAVEEERTLYGLNPEAKKRVKKYANYERIYQELPEDERAGSSGLTDIDKEGKKPQLKRVNPRIAG